MPTIAVIISEMLSTLLPYTLDPFVLNLLVLMSYYYYVCVTAKACLACYPTHIISIAAEV